MDDLFSKILTQIFFGIGWVIGAIFKLLFYFLRFVISSGVSSYRSSRVTEYHAVKTSRFEHTLIVGGSGHGKTQLMQSLILYDLPLVAQGKNRLLLSTVRAI